MSQSGLLQRGYNDKIRNAILNEVANDLAQQKSCLKPGQRLSSRLYNDAMQSLAAHNVHINQEALKKRVARASDDLNSSSHTNVIIVGSPSSTPSTLTAPSTANTNTGGRYGLTSLIASLKGYCLRRGRAGGRAGRDEMADGDGEAMR